MSSNIDELFKNSLKDQEISPPEYVWENISKRLDDRKRVIGLWKFGAVAAILFLGIGLGGWLLKDANSEYVQAPIATMKAFKDVEKSLNYSLIQERKKEQGDVLIVKKYSPKNNIAQQMQTSAIRLPHAMSIIKNDLFIGVMNSHPPIILKNKSIIQNIVPLTSKESLKNNKEYAALLTNESEEKSPRRKMHILLSGHIIPAYSDGKYVSSVQNVRGKTYSKQQLNGIMNLGGGVKLAINTGKRLSIQTGILYTRMGQQAVSERSLFRRTTFAKENKITSTPLGNIKVRNHSIAFRDPQEAVLNAGSNENIEQVFGSLEVPLSLRYQLNTAQRVQFSLIGGINGGFLVNNKVYLKNDRQKQWLGSTEDIRSFNLSTNIGLGVEYPIGPKIKVMLEPGFKYYLQSLSNNSMIDFKPYMFTLSTGIGIRF